GQHLLHRRHPERPHPPGGPMITRLTVVALLLGLALPAFARSHKAEPKSTPELLAAARGHMADLDFDKAAPLLKKALKDDALQGDDRAHAFLDLGVCEANLNQDE